MADTTANRKRGRTEAEADGNETSNIDQIIAEQVINPTNAKQPSAKKARVEERRSIFVRSLPPSVTNEGLAEFFSEYFPVKHATVITDPKTKESRGYGFVTFADAEDASQAKTALDKKLWDGRSIRVDIAEPRSRNNAGESKPTIPGRPTSRNETQNATKLIVRNLPWSVKTSEQLSHLFRSFGKVKFADLPSSKGKLKGFGFVTLRGRKNAEKALETINGKEIDGRTLAVDWAVDKATWEGQNQKDDGEKGNKEAKEEAETSDAAKDEDDDQVDSKKEGVDADLANFLKNHMQNMEDEDDEDEEKDDDDEDEEDDGEDGEGEQSKSKESQKSTDNSSTIFIRNLPFTTTDEQLKSFFMHFGKVRYARVVMDKATDRPAGTGFVCFFNDEDAKTCVKGAPRPQQPTTTKAKHSILQDENADPDGKYTLDGRLLQVAQAVSKETAANLADSSSVKRREKDKRRLFLLSEGSIGRNSPIFNLLSQPELQMRQASAAQRKKLVEKNPSLHISLTRLAIRNIPRDIGSKELKDLARKAIVGFAKDVREGRRQPLSKEENARDGKDAKEKERDRKQKGKGIVRQAKIVFESNQGSKVDEKSGAGKSRGYGFIEYTSHHWALMGLRYLNGMQLDGDNNRKQRLIVEFAIENAQVVQRRRANEQNTTQAAQKQHANAKPKQESGKDEQVSRILKENKKARGKDGQRPTKGKGKGKEEIEDEGDDKPDMKQTLIARKRLMRKKKAQSRGK
ncbi:unnamed protein product [Clonostachys rosea f. rosea IK726]|uniref:RRM domain-containing protein n=2 Tax=Bionectria ochroleuca TaxID=29856 RepID=A0A0B7JQN5_BIOOC|nr:unnamed protein product [Clonostachys rosea f. rosea IK726]